MTSLLALPRTPAVGLHLHRLDLPHGTREARPDSESTLRDAARDADVIRLRHSAAVPSAAALARVVGLIEDELADVGRPRTDVRLVLELPVAVVEDGAAVTRKRAELAYLDALTGLSWSPSATWLVTTPARLVDDTLSLAAPLAVDDVLLLPLGARSAAAVA